MLDEGVYVARDGRFIRAHEARRRFGRDPLPPEIVEPVEDQRPIAWRHEGVADIPVFGRHRVYRRFHLQSPVLLTDAEVAAFIAQRNPWEGAQEVPVVA